MGKYFTDITGKFTSKPFLPRFYRGTVNRKKSTSLVVGNRDSPFGLQFARSNQWQLHTDESVARRGEEEEEEEGLDFNFDLSARFSFVLSKLLLQ